MSDAKDLIGRTIARKYVLLGLLGEGGMGAVYEARHTELGRRVAIKVISRESHGGEYAERLRREARAASAIESDYIVHVHDVGQDDESGIYMVMEHLEGEDLARHLDREKKLDVDTAVLIASQVARALAKAHAAGVVHRDLKPANIFLTRREDGSLVTKVLDFGISKFLRAEDRPSRSDSRQITRAGSVVGTPQYMAPEQAQGLETLDHRVDIWSLGTVLYEALSGVPAFEDLPTYEQTILRIILGAPKPLTEIAPWVSQPLADVVHAAIEHDLSRRIPSCTVFLERLRIAMNLPGESSFPRLPDVDAASVALTPDALLVVPISQRVTAKEVFQPTVAAEAGPQPSHRRPGTADAVMVTPRDTVEAPLVSDGDPDEPQEIGAIAPSPPWRTIGLVAAIGLLIGVAGAGVLVVRGRSSPAAAGAQPPAASASVAAVVAREPAPAASASSTSPAPSSLTSTGAAAASSSAALSTTKPLALPTRPPRPAPSKEPDSPSRKFGGVDVSDQY